MLLSSVFDGQNYLDFDAYKAGNRAFRMQEQITSTKEMGEWLPVSRVIPFYRNNDTAVMDSLYMDMYDAESEEWIPGTMKSYFEYNAAGRMVNNTIYMVMMDMLIPMIKVSSSYDDQNRIVQNFVYGGDFENPGAWIIQNRMYIIYGPGTTFEVYSWEDEEDFRTPVYGHSTFSYDGQGRIVEELGYVSADSTSWVQDYKCSYTYHPQDTSTGESFIEHVSNGLSMMVMNDGYDLPGLITLEEEMQWTGSAWIPDYRSSREFNAQLQLITSQEEYYQDENWMDDYLSTYFYDVNGCSDYTIGQYYNGSAYEDEERIDYSWESYSSVSHDGVAPTAILSVNAYPSPFSTDLRIEVCSESKAPVSISIHNLRGQNVRSFAASNAHPYTWDGKDNNGDFAPTGIYFIRATQNGKSSIRKVMRVN